MFFFLISSLSLMEDADPILRHSALPPSLDRYCLALRFHLLEQAALFWATLEHHTMKVRFLHLSSVTGTVLFFVAKDAPWASGFKHVGRVYQPSHSRMPVQKRQTLKVAEN